MMFWFAPYPVMLCHKKTFLDQVIQFLKFRHFVLGVAIEVLVIFIVPTLGMLLLP